MVGSKSAAVGLALAKPYTPQNNKKSSIVPGIALAASIAVIALLISRWQPVLGGPVAGIVLGLVLRNTWHIQPIFDAGLQFSAKKILPYSIVGLGFSFSLQQVAQTGMDSIGITIVSIAAAFFSAWALGKYLGIAPKLKLLIGVGTAICGGSAIAAVTPIIKPEEHDVAFAITTIFIFNIVAVLLFPALGHSLGMSDQMFGMWAGIAINDTSSVVAAGYSYSQQAGDYATIVKLTRATLIIPICFALIALQFWQQKKSNDSTFSLVRIFPWFILWFVVASGVRTLGFIPEAIDAPLRLFADFLIVLALSAIGLSSNLRTMRAAGIRPILLGLGVWVAVALSSLLFLYVAGTW